MYQSNSSIGRSEGDHAETGEESTYIDWIPGFFYNFDQRELILNLISWDGKASKII